MGDVAGKKKVSPTSTRDERLNRIHVDFNVTFGINIKDENKDQFLVAHDKEKQKDVIVKIYNHKGSIFASIEGSPAKPLLEVVDSGKFEFLRSGKSIEKINESIIKEFEKGIDKLYVGSVEDKKVVNAAVIEKDSSNTIVISEINGKEAKEPFERVTENYLGYIEKKFHKCVLMTKDEYDRMTKIGEDITISQERVNLGYERLSSMSLER